MAITDEMLFAGTRDGRIMAWKFPSKESKIEPVFILSGHQRPVVSLSISARRLYSGSLDKTIKVWIFPQDIAQLTTECYVGSDAFFISLYLPGMGPYDLAVCSNTL
jgi:WD40 repeat protein